VVKINNMSKQLDKDMMRMMTVTERFNYMAAKKRMQHNIDSSSVTCSYSGLPSMEVYKDEPGASLEEQAKHTDWEDDWIDRDDDNGYDSASDGGSKRVDESYDDSNEY
tara:strand:- start:494 stop:817 length:324 start_codon:yes stop_codon:yes gene_type:complete